MHRLLKIFEKMVAILEKIHRELGEIKAETVKVHQQEVEIKEVQTKLLDEVKALIVLVSPPMAVSFRIDLEASKIGEFNMKAHKATLDLVVFENGQATATLIPVDASGNPTDMPVGATVPVWTPSDPSITVSASADGTSALLTAGTTPLVAATVTASSTLADGTTTITGTSDPFDVQAQPPGAAVSFKIVIA